MKTSSLLLVLSSKIRFFSVGASPPRKDEESPLSNFSSQPKSSGAPLLSASSCRLISRVGEEQEDDSWGVLCESCC